MVCNACYVYHTYCDLGLVPMRRILRLMFDFAMPFLFYSVAALDLKFDPAFRRRHPRFGCPWGGHGHYLSNRACLWVPFHLLEGPDSP